MSGCITSLGLVFSKGNIVRVYFRLQTHPSAGKDIRFVIENRSLSCCEVKMLGELRSFNALNKLDQCGRAGASIGSWYGFQQECCSPFSSRRLTACLQCVFLLPSSLSDLDMSLSPSGKVMKSAGESLALNLQTDASGELRVSWTKVRLNSTKVNIRPRFMFLVGNGW